MKEQKIIPVFGNHATGFEADQKYIQCSESYKNGLVPEVFAWNQKTIGTVKALSPSILAIDGLYLLTEHNSLFYASPGNPFDLRNPHDVFIVGGDPIPLLFLLPPPELRVSGTYIQEWVVHFNLGWLGEETVQTYLAEVRDFHREYLAMAESNPEEIVSPEFFAKSRRIVNPVLFNIKEIDMRNAFFMLKLRQAQKLITEDELTTGPTIILFGSGHKHGRDVWKDNGNTAKEVAKESITDIINFIGRNLSANNIEFDCQRCKLLNRELLVILAITNVWRVKNRPKTLALSQVEHQIPEERIFICDSIAQIIRSELKNQLCPLKSPSDSCEL